VCWGEVVLRDRVTDARMYVCRARLCFAWSCICFV